MSAREEVRDGKKTGRWYFRIQTKINGKSVRLDGVPAKYGQPNTKKGALEAERLAIAYARGEMPTPASLKASASVADAAPHPAHGEAVTRAAASMPTVREYLATWLAKSRADNRPGTAKKKQKTFERDILPTFGSLRLDEVSFANVEAWRVGLINRGMAPSTVRRIMIEFRALLGYAHKSDVLAKLPGWPKQKVPKPHPKFLTFEETSRLIAAAAPLDPWQAMIIVAVRTGLRYGELAALRWQDVDLDGYKLTVEENFVAGITGPPKSGHGRVIPLSRDAHAALVAIRHNRGPLVFCGRRGTHIHHSTAVLAIKEISHRAGLAGVHWHRLRHTFASHLVIRGVGLRAVMDLMGHSKFELTLRYAHLAPEMRREAVMLLDDPAPAPRAWPSPDPRANAGDDGDDEDDEDDDEDEDEEEEDDDDGGERDDGHDGNKAASRRRSPGVPAVPASTSSP